MEEQMAAVRAWNSDSEHWLIPVCVSGGLSFFGGCSEFQKAVLVNKLFTELEGFGLGNLLAYLAF
jgi:hypothetical protein